MWALLVGLMERCHLEVHWWREVIYLLSLIIAKSGEKEVEEMVMSSAYRNREISGDLGISLIKRLKSRGLKRLP